MRFLKLYIHTYNGLSKPAWMLACVLLINRSGAMVLPFLSLYLKDELQFTAEHVSIVLMLFGVGSLIGSYLGGYLSDKIGTFWVQFYSLILTGIGFILISHLTSFPTLAIGFFCLTIISESFRPANTASVAKHAKPENLTRAYSLNRMAINLGFAVGPSLGGFLAHIGYEWLFYGNAVSSIASGLFFAYYFYSRRDKKAPVLAETESESVLKSPFKDLTFIGVFGLTVLFGVVFFQLLFTLPVYYREHYQLSETAIGWLIGLNGLIVFLLEMPLVYIAGKRFDLNRIIAFGCVLLGISYLVLHMGYGVGFLIGAMVFMSISEILVMPFLTTYTANRGGERSRGKYLGMYAMSYSVSFIVAPALGYFIIEKSGYQSLWLLLAVLAGVITLGYLYVINGTKAETEMSKVLEKVEANFPD